ncbi:MAG: lytic murein transglycosylase [Proteobacteria bacterium]|nr:lytic murein transglycosylase [Pseudomonadota bacterium]MBU1451877.1 lytic murein transglycosylase [Pseudomonadota bacterium]MBU2470132.1 lytic murein transglycosylase [Pseudomonadota bacterium]
MTSFKISRWRWSREVLALSLAFFLLLALLPSTSPAAATDQSVFAPLRAEMIRQGVDPAKVDALLGDKSVRFESRLMAVLLAPSERSLNYGQFLGPKTVKAGKEFIREHAAVLARAQKDSGVDPTVVVAILSVESRLGVYTGRWSVFNVLASQAVLDTPQAQKLLAQAWPAKQRAELDSAKTQKRLKRRAAWARREMGSLMRLAGKEGRSPLEYKGSLAGALGMAQFMPSSVLNWGKDGDADGVLELAHAEDAIHSVANYLRAHGWRPGLSLKAQLKVVLTYNNSKPYAKTVLALAGRLR